MVDQLKDFQAPDSSEKDEEDVEEAADEVPGFGLISAVAAIGAVLLLRRRL